MSATLSVFIGTFWALCGPTGETIDPPESDRTAAMFGSEPSRAEPRRKESVLKLLWVGSGSGVGGRERTRQRHADLPQHGPGPEVGPPRGGGCRGAVHHEAEVSGGGVGAAGDPPWRRAGVLMLGSR